MQKPAIFAASIAAVLAGPAVAADPAAGETAFARNCMSCHNVIDDGGNILVGRAQTRQGPNLWGIIGATAASVEGFRYSASLQAAAEAGLVWDEENLAEFIANPTGWLRDHLGDPRARSTMTHRQGAHSADIAAYLAGLGPDGAAD